MIIKGNNIDFTQKKAWVTSNNQDISPSASNLVRYLSGEHPLPITFTNCVISCGIFLNGKAKFINCYLPKTWEGKVDSENCKFNQEGEWLGRCDENSPAYIELKLSIKLEYLGEKLCSH